MAAIDEYNSDESSSDQEPQRSPRQRRNSISSDDETHDLRVAMQTIGAIRNLLNDNDTDDSSDDEHLMRRRPQPRDSDDESFSEDEVIINGIRTIDESSVTSKISFDQEAIEQLVTVHDVREFLRAYAIQRLLSIMKISTDTSRSLIPNPHRQHLNIGRINNPYFCTRELAPGKPCNRPCERSKTPDDRHLCRICLLDPEVQVSLGKNPNHYLLKLVKSCYREPYNRTPIYCSYQSCNYTINSTGLGLCDKHFTRIDVLIQGFKLTTTEISRYRVRDLYSQKELQSADGVNLHVRDCVGLDFTDTTFLVVHGHYESTGIDKIHGLRILTCYNRGIHGVFPSLRTLNIYSELEQRSFIVAPNLESLGVSTQSAAYLAADAPKLNGSIELVQEIRNNYTTLLHATRVIQAAMLKWIRRLRMQKFQKILDWDYVLGIPYDHKQVPKFVPWLYQKETLQARRSSYFGDAPVSLGSGWIIKEHRFANVVIEVMRRFKESTSD
jgi:hypothetical protein